MRTIELSGLILTSIARVELQRGFWKFLTACLITEGLKPLFTATDLNN